MLTGDCLDLAPQLPDGCFDLLALDPPYGIDWPGYDKFKDNMRPREFIDWCTRWIALAWCKLHKHGSMWIAIGDEYVSELDMICKQLGLHKRNHVIWYYGFGQACQGKFSRTHTHWLYYTKAKTRFTFNDQPVRVSSARLLKYGDKRADPKGCLPHDVWVLHPDELAKCFHPSEDVWRESRQCGTFNSTVQRGKYQLEHTCPQMPSAIMDRIIVSCSNPGDLVGDFFSGNGTTGESAVRNGRLFWGCDISENYVALGRQRMDVAIAEAKDFW